MIRCQFFSTETTPQNGASPIFSKGGGGFHKRKTSKRPNHSQHKKTSHLSVCYCFSGSRAITKFFFQDRRWFDKKVSHIDECQTVGLCEASRSRGLAAQQQLRAQRWRSTPRHDGMMGKKPAVFGFC